MPVRLTITGSTFRQGRIDRGSVHVVDGRFEDEPGPRDRHVDLPAGWIAAPGFVDLQVNGFAGHEVGGSAEGHAAIARALAAEGVTAFCPTLISGTEKEYERAATAFAGTRWPDDGSRSLGIHLEGPLLSPARHGAHPPDAVDAADASLVRRLVELLRPRVVTLSPERDRALPLIAELATAGVVVSLGHTEAPPELMDAAFAAGASMLTHAFNAMPGLEARAPGPLGAALLDANVFIGVIADGVHVHPRMLALLVRLTGPRLIAVSDAVSATSAAAGVHRLAGGGTIRRLGDRIENSRGGLAGSALGLGGAASRLRAAGCSTEQALAAVCDAPREALGMSASLTSGEPADLVILDRELRPRATLLDGHVVWGELP